MKLSINDGWLCNFCGADNRVEMFNSKCKKCNITFSLFHQPPSWNDWFLTGIAYNIGGPIYHSLEMYWRQEPSTTLWFSSAGNKMKSIVIPKVFPIFKPEKAIDLAGRLHKMRAFL
jgi:hypothetical protein